jgi:hypothetical protein
MSEIRVDKLKGEDGSSTVEFTTGATIPSGKTVSGAGGLNISGSYNNITGVAATFTGDVIVGGTLSYEDVTNIDAVGIITAQAGIDVTGIITARAGSAVTFRGGVDVLDAAETVSVGATSHVVGDTITLELDCANGTVFTHDGDNGQVGILSITNFPATKNSFHTVTLIHTQTGTTPSGVGNTTAATGIGTQITLTPRGVTGFTTAAQVGSGTSITCSTTAGDVDIITFGIHYNGGTNTDANNYKTFGTKNGDFRLP